MLVIFAVNSYVVRCCVCVLLVGAWRSCHGHARCPWHSRGHVIRNGRRDVSGPRAHPRGSRDGRRHTRDGGVARRGHEAKGLRYFFAGVGSQADGNRHGWPLVRWFLVHPANSPAATGWIWVVPGHLVISCCSCKGGPLHQALLTSSVVVLTNWKSCDNSASTSAGKGLVNRRLKLTVLGTARPKSLPILLSYSHLCSDFDVVTVVC